MEDKLDGRYGRNGSTESELNFGLNKELLSRTDAKVDDKEPFWFLDKVDWVQYPDGFTQ